MRATEVLQTCLRDALGSMHALRRRVLLRYGQAFEDSLTRKGASIEALLLLSALAAFATWLVGMACEANGTDRWLNPFASKRRLYSVMRLGREVLVRRWLKIPLHRLLAQLNRLRSPLLHQLGVPA